MAYQAAHVEESSSTPGTHLYRVTLALSNGSRSTEYVILDTVNHEVSAALPTGEPLADLRMIFEEDGNLTRPAPLQDERITISRGDFASIASHIWHQWRKEGVPPQKVTRYFA